MHSTLNFHDSKFIYYSILENDSALEFWIYHQYTLCFYISSFIKDIQFVFSICFGKLIYHMDAQMFFFNVKPTRDKNYFKNSHKNNYFTENNLKKYLF